MAELIGQTEELQSTLNQEVLLHRITNHIRQSLELPEILAATVAEVRLFLGTDRVMVHQFHADGSGVVIAESIHNSHLLPLLGLNFPVDDIPAHARNLFLQARQRSIVDVAAQQIGLSPLDCPETGEPLANVEICYRPAAPCHLQYLEAMGVQFSLAVPLVCRHAQTGQPKSELWGLLVAHHVEPRSISESELTIVQRVADQVAIAIAQSTLYSQMQTRAEREAIVNSITALLHASPEIQFQVALEAVVEMLEGSGGRLFIYAEGPNQFADLYTCGHQPSYPDEEGVLIEAHPLWQACTGISSLPAETATFLDSNYHVYAIPDLYQTTSLHLIGPAFRNSPIRSILIVPLYYQQNLLGFLTVFRNAISIETHWAGRFNSSQQQLQPRRSFQAWKELKHGQVHQWTEADIELAQVLGNPFSLAIQQYHLYSQVQQINADLEHQVQERTAELRQSFDHLKQTQTQLIQTEKMSSLGQLVAGVAHEINNPVNLFMATFITLSNTFKM
jgi:light-regulated signal transduction histidine kinase (bacteriophytochrome)